MRIISPSILRRLAAAALLGCCVAAHALHAQEGMLIGPVFGYEFGVPLDLDRAPGIINRRQFDGRGWSYNHTISGGVHLLVPDLFAPDIGGGARLLYGASDGQFKSFPYEAYVADASGLDSINAWQSFRVRGMSHLLQLDMRLHYRLTPAWGGNAGAWGQFRFSSNLAQSESIISPEELVYPGGEKTRNIAEDDAIASDPFRYGVALGTSVDIPLSRSVGIRPELYGRLDIGALARGVGVRSLSVGGGFSLLIDPDPELDIPMAAPDTAPIVREGSDTAARALLWASVDLYLTAEDGTRSEVAIIRSRSRAYRHYMPLLPVLFFDAGSARLPTRYVRLDTAARESFSRATLARLDAVALYHQTLNVIGWRLRAEPEARVVLYGSAAQGEEGTLARMRGEEVAGYLRDVWGIAENRIEIGKGRPPLDLGSGTERAVQIISSSDRVMAPVVAEWVERERYVPRIGMIRSVRSEAGVRGWSMTVRRGDAVLARYADSDDESFGGLDGAFLLRGEGDSLAPIVAELTVEDMTGRSTTAHDTLRVLGESQQGPESGGELLTYTFIGMDRDAPFLTRGNNTLLARLATAVGNGARVTVLDRGASGPDGEIPQKGIWGGGAVAENLLKRLRENGKRAAEVRLVPGSLPADIPVGAELRLLQTGGAVVVEQDRPVVTRERP